MAPAATTWRINRPSVPAGTVGVDQSLPRMDRGPRARGGRGRGRDASIRGGRAGGRVAETTGGGASPHRGASGRTGGDARGSDALHRPSPPVRHRPRMGRRSHARERATDASVPLQHPSPAATPRVAAPDTPPPYTVSTPPPPSLPLTH